MDDLAQRTPNGAARADAEQVFRGRVQVRDEQLVVEQNDGRG